MPTPKHAFLAALDCPTKGWRAQHERSSPPTPAGQWRFREGQLVQRLAREWLGPGRLLPGGWTGPALRVTADAVAAADATLLFEATFEAEGCIARADALRRLGDDGWSVLEIKSGSIRDDKATKDDYIEDLAYTCAVARAAGLKVHRAILVLVNGDYVEGVSESLFVEVDVTTDVFERADLFGDHLPEIADTLAGDRPRPALRYCCRHCDHFAVDCVGCGIADPLFDLPGLRESRWERLVPHGPRISDLPPDADLTDNMTAYVQVIRSGHPMVDHQVLGRLDTMSPPVYYLDFEAIAPAVPVFAGSSPYQKHPFQYSLHVRLSDDTMEHRDYLADHATDWRRDLAERLLADLGSSGPIVVYSNYEAQCLKQLASWFPDLESRVTAVIDRLFDLEKVVRKGYIHPGFRGRSSIKKVLPVMAPEFSYDDLDVSGGEDAAAVFGFMWMGEYPAEDHQRHRGSLLEYCKLDTLAMVRVHEGLEALGRATRNERR